VNRPDLIVAWLPSRIPPSPERLQSQIDKFEERRRDQLGVALNFVFLVASAALGMIVSIAIADKRPHFSSSQESLFILATGFFSGTVLLGIIANGLRFEDFRQSANRDQLRLNHRSDASVIELERLWAEHTLTTKQELNKRFSAKGHPAGEIYSLIKSSRRLGLWTLRLFWAHMFTLIAGGGCFIACVSWPFWRNLFN
jgi:hypothetical protein